MSRAPEEVEADLAAARQTHQDAVEAHGRAKQLAGSLKARAIAGDPTVSAQDLALADDAAYMAELPIAAKFAAIKPFQTEHDVLSVNRYADEVTAQRLANRAELEHAWADLVAARDRFVLLWRADASYLDHVTQAIGSQVRIDVSPRVARSGHNAIVDGVALRRADALEPFERLSRDTNRRLLDGQPKAMR